MSLFSLLLGSKDLNDIMQNIDAKNGKRRLLAAINLQNLASERDLPNNVVKKVALVLQRENEDIRTATALLRTLFHIDNENSIKVAEWYICRLAKDILEEKSFLERGFSKFVLQDIHDYLSPTLISYYAVCFALTGSILNTSLPESHTLTLYGILKSMGTPDLLELVPEEKRERFDKALGYKEAFQKVVAEKTPVIAAKALNAAIKHSIETAIHIKLPLNTKIISDQFFDDLDVLMIPYVKEIQKSPYVGQVEIPIIESVPKQKIREVLSKYVYFISNICEFPSLC